MASVSASAPMPGRPAGHRAIDRSSAAIPLPQGPYAAIDLGTNNCRLLIARPSNGAFTVVDAFSRIVRLGEGLATSGRLTQDAMDRSVEALGVCADKLRRRRVGLARSVATEACRRAANGRDFIERVREETGIVLEIIAPQEEARLAVLGCHKLLEEGDGPAIIFDIGGGSTELVLLEPNGPDGNPRIKAWWSAPWGVVSLTEAEGREAIEGPDRVSAYNRMKTRAAHAFDRFAQLLPERTDNIRLLGTSGTVTTLASVHLALPSYDRRAVDGLHVPIEAMRDISTSVSPRWTSRGARRFRASARNGRTWWSPVAPSSRRSSTSGPPPTSASPTAASAKASCAA